MNKEKLTTLLGYINQALGVLEGYARADQATLIGEPEKLGNLKYQFVIALEACIDICNHIAARGNMEAPESYGHCFELLGGHTIIEQRVADKMAELARFRNVLVHLYWKVDDRRVLQVLKNDLGTIREFMRSIAQYAQ